MKISVSSYSFSQQFRAGKMTQLDCVAKAKEMGFDAIEFTDIVGDNLAQQKEYARKIREEADRVGIEINAYTIGANLFQPTPEAQAAEIERLKGQVEVAAILGAKVMRHDVCYSLGKTGASRSFGLMLPTIADGAHQVTAYAETYGIKTCTENHGYIAQDSYRVEQLFNAVAHDNYGLLVDIGNFICADEDPAMAVSRVAPYAVHVHLKDMLVRSAPTGACTAMTRGGNYFCGTVVGEGDVPVKQCLRIIRATGYDGFLSLEYEGAEDCLTGIARGLANVKKILEELQ
jgi:sugar phosphate isomerase/epimerase